MAIPALLPAFVPVTQGNTECWVTNRVYYLMALWRPGTDKQGTELTQGSRRRLRKAITGEKNAETESCAR